MKIEKSIPKLFVVALVLSGCSNSPSNEVQNPGDLPNVIIIMADDVGFSDIYAYDTPNIDSLQGTRYMDAHASASVCTPSRYSLLTSMYPPFHGVIGEEGHESVLDAPIMADYFAARGYETLMAGKWHLGGIPPFDKFSYFEMVPDDPTTISQEIVDFFESNKPDDPYFAYIAPWAVHFGFWSDGDPLKHDPRFDEGYYGFVDELDWLVGEIRRIDPDALIVLTSDNGAWDWGQFFTYKGHKGLLEEAGHRIPLIVPWVDDPDRLVSHMDIWPMIAYRLFGEQLIGIDGQLERDSLTHQSWNGREAHRDGDLKYYPEAPALGDGNAIYDRGNIEEQLYDLLDDPFEQNNLLEM